jgi:hypothetical protein
MLRCEWFSVVRSDFKGDYVTFVDIPAAVFVRNLNTGRRFVVVCGHEGLDLRVRYLFFQISVAG